MTKKANVFRIRFARAKNEPHLLLFASEASKKYHNAFSVMYLDVL
jgi:hypothetical protein